MLLEHGLDSWAPLGAWLDSEGPRVHVVVDLIRRSFRVAAFYVPGEGEVLCGPGGGPAV